MSSGECSHRTPIHGGYTHGGGAYFQAHERAYLLRVENFQLRSAAGSGLSPRSTTVLPIFTV